MGGYGATGRAVVPDLLKSGEGEIVLGGRVEARLEAAAARFGSRVWATRLDVMDARSLEEFCGRCSVVLNCDGPVMLLRDRVAQAALHARCHYLDLAGMGIVKEVMLPHGGDIERLGLSFVVSAGWMPGVTEVLPAYAHAQARRRMDSIESVSVYFSDCGDWSENALRDGFFHLRRVGLSRPGYFRQGQRVRAKASEASRKVDLGGPIGLRRFSLLSTPELDDVGRALADCEFRSHAYLSGLRNAVAAVTIALLPLPEEQGVRMLRGMFHRSRLPIAGFAVAHVAGRSGGRRAALEARVEFNAGQEYWMNGVALATAGRMVASGNRVRTGVRYLFEAVEPTAFMAELRKAGVRQSEVFEFSD